MCQDCNGNCTMYMYIVRVQWTCILIGYIDDDDNWSIFSWYLLHDWSLCGSHGATKGQFAHFTMVFPFRLFNKRQIFGHNEKMKKSTVVSPSSRRSDTGQESIAWPALFSSSLLILPHKGSSIFSSTVNYSQSCLGLQSFIGMNRF